MERSPARARDSIGLVPTISVFYGIVIRMFARDHPPPHFHARYGEHHARIAITDGSILDGHLPPRPARLVKRWAMAHHSQLEANWARCEAMLPPHQIDPLP